MAHEENVGRVIAGPPEDENVNKWKEFLTKPENLATALVLVAGITGPKREGQTDLNKALVSGVGALGFRGGLEKGVDAQRAGKREEGRTVQAQDAEIAAGQAVTSQGARRNEILGQRVEQEGQPRPQSPSDIALTQAQTGLANAQTDALGVPTPPPTLEGIFTQRMTEALAINPDANTQEIFKKAQEEFTLIELARQGVGPGNTVDLTEEQMKILGIPIPDVADPDAADPDASKPASKRDKRRTGNVVPASLLEAEGEQSFSVNRQRRVPGFENLDDATILDRVEEARELASDKAQLRALSQERLISLLEDFSGMLSGDEKVNVRLALRATRVTKSQRLQLRLDEPQVRGGNRIF